MWEGVTKATGRVRHTACPNSHGEIGGAGKGNYLLGNSATMTLRLPAEKLRELRALVAGWLEKRFCTIKELQSLVGKLQHACKVVRPGRTFLRRMFELMKGSRKSQRFVRLNASFRSDLMWWHRFMATWNGVAMMADQSQDNPHHHMYSDASGSFGCGAWWGEQWFQFL